MRNKCLEAEKEIEKRVRMGEGWRLLRAVRGGSLGEENEHRRIE